MNCNTMRNIVDKKMRRPVQRALSVPPLGGEQANYSKFWAWHQTICGPGPYPARAVIALR